MTARNLFFLISFRLLPPLFSYVESQDSQAISAFGQRGTRASRKSPSITVQGLICSEESWQRRGAPQHSSCCSSGGAVSGFEGPAAAKKLKHHRTLQHRMRRRSSVCICVRLLYFSFLSTATRPNISSEDSCSYLYQEILPIIFSIARAAAQRAACCYPSLRSGVGDSWAARTWEMGDCPASEMQQEERDHFVRC